MPAKVDVNGNDADPLYRWLRRAAPGVPGSTAIKWSFTNFLVGRDGTTVERFAPTTRPGALEPEIARALA